MYRRMNNNQYQDEEEYYGRYPNPNGVYHYERPLRGISRHNTQSDGIILPVIFFMGIMFFGVMVFGLVHFGVFSNDASTTTGYMFKNEGTYSAHTMPQAVFYRNGQVISSTTFLANNIATSPIKTLQTSSFSHTTTTTTTTKPLIRDDTHIINDAAGDLYQRLKNGQRYEDRTTSTYHNPDNRDITDLSGKSNMPVFDPPPKCIYKNLMIAGIDVQADIPKTFPSRNLILGIAANIDIKNFVIFCASLRKSNIKATTILFMNYPIPNEHQKVAEKNNISLLVYDRKALEPEFIRSYHPSSLRWILFDWFFTIEQGKYVKEFDYILTLDVRDSVFQSDPFDLFDNEYKYSLYRSVFSPVPKSPDDPIVNEIGSTRMKANDTRLFLFGENQLIPLSACSWNRGWVKDCFGERIYNLIKSQSISCSGISMGGTIRMVDYFNKMGQILLDNYPCLPGKFPTCERNGVDQGIHNVLLHLNYLDPLSVKYATTFPIVNLQSSPELMVHNDVEKEVKSISMINQRVKYAIVHQYDRDPKLQLGLGRQYIPWIDWDNPMADWAHNKVCTKNFGVVFGVDFMKGKCDLSMGRGMTPSSCCEVCLHQREATNASILVDPSRGNDLKFCTGFTYSKGVCYMKHCPASDIISMIQLISDPNFKDVQMMDEKIVSGYLLLT